MNRNPVLIAARRAIDVAAELERRGCRVVGAHANGALPTVRITPPPQGVINTWGYRPDCGYPTCVAHLDGVRIEWESRP
jgi:hypothetical protein